MWFVVCGLALQQSKVFASFPKEQLENLIESVVVKEYPENCTILDRENRTKVLAKSKKP